MSSSSTHPRNITTTNVVDCSTTTVQKEKFHQWIDYISFYGSHCLHGIIYYYCVKYIFETFVWNHHHHPTSTTNDDSNSNIISSLAFYGVYHRTPYNQMIHLIGVPFIIWTMILYGSYLPFTSTITTTKNSQKFTNVSSLNVNTTKQQQSKSRLLLPTILLWPSSPTDHHVITWATLWVLLYGSFYYYIDWIGACLYTPFLYIMYVTSVHWSQQDLQQQNVSFSTKKIKVDNDNNDDAVIDRSPERILSRPWYGTGTVLWYAFLLHVLSWYIQIHLGHSILEGATPASLVNLGAALTSAPLFAFYEMIWYLGYRISLQQQVLQQVAIYTEQLCRAGANLRVCMITTNV